MANGATPATVNRRAQRRQVDEVQTGGHCMPGLAPQHTGFPQAGASPLAGPPADASRAERATRAFEAFGGALVPDERLRRSRRVGVLALQGDFREHLAALRACEVEGVPIRLASDLEAVDALNLPGRG